MANILDSIIPDPDTGLYSSRVLGINGNECIINNYGASDFAGLENTVLFYLKNDTDDSNKLSFWLNNHLLPVSSFNPGIDRRGWVFLINTGWTWLEPQIFEQQQYAPIWMWFNDLQYPFEPLTGTVSVSLGATNVTGNNTIFTVELSIGKKIKIGTQIFKVTNIISDTNIQISSAHITGASGVTAYADSSIQWCYLDRSYIGQHWCFEQQYINPVASGGESIYDSNIKIFEPGKLEGFGVRLYVHNLRGNGDEGMRAFIINSLSQIFMSTETVDQPSKQLTYARVK